MIKENNKSVKKQPIYATKDDFSDVLKAINRGFDLMEGRFQVLRDDNQLIREDLNIMREDLNIMREDLNIMREDMDKQFHNVFTVLDGQSKKSEGFEQEKYSTFHAIQRLEQEIDRVKKHLHL